MHRAPDPPPATSPPWAQPGPASPAAESTVPWGELAPPTRAVAAGEAEPPPPTEALPNPVITNIGLQAAAEGPLDVTERYEIVARLGVGGMGEVFAAQDRLLLRRVAMKVIRAEFCLEPEVRRRFVIEARTNAQLEHPGIVPLYDHGLLPDGRLFFTMKEVRGRTLEEELRRATSTPRGPARLRRGIELLQRVSEAVEFAHSRGVLHRDLKPGNVMLGDHGEVLVMDWGIAKVFDQSGAGHRREPVSIEPGRTRMGAVVGSPGYMAPEQRQGRLDLLGPHTDVYALGRILLELLRGGARADPAIEALTALVTAATEDDLARRPASAAAFGAELQDWLDDARKQERAEARVQAAEAHGARARGLRNEAAEARRRAAEGLRGTEPTSPIEHKRASWEAEDLAERLDRQAEQAEADWLEGQLAALEADPDHGPAKSALADHYQGQFRAAEAAQDVRVMAQAEARLRRLDDGRHGPWLAGTGSLSLEVDAPDATATLSVYRAVDRRLQPEPIEVGLTLPIDRRSLPMGSYLLELRAPGRIEVRLPLHIGRMEAVTWNRPGATRPEPLHLPLAEGWDPDDRYVPAGWAWTGSVDLSHKGALPRRRLWLDGFVIRRHPVTNAEFIALLDELVDQGREAEALSLTPAYIAAHGSSPIYGRDARGHFVLQPDADGDTWEADWPVVMVDHSSAEAYAAAFAHRRGAPWRLPTEWEWEKAARGADGRAYPWGDFLDPTFCTMRATHRQRPTLRSIHAAPLDESPYGVSGLGGNVSDWTATPYRPGGPPVSPEGLPLAEPQGGAERYVARGGAWIFTARECRAEARFDCPAERRRDSVGLRLARSLSPPRQG